MLRLTVFVGHCSNTTADQNTTMQSCSDCLAKTKSTLSSLPATPTTPNSGSTCSASGQNGGPDTSYVSTCKWVLQQVNWWPQYTSPGQDPHNYGGGGYCPTCGNNNPPAAAPSNPGNYQQLNCT